mmetsp:Transcript_13737/g.43450  ORF Transcript_13737/g.43450 Transcript_13737/m.43450 type:complete len:211 (+) Transcript_13737:1493-2125(+)
MQCNACNAMKWLPLCAARAGSPGDHPPPGVATGPGRGGGGRGGGVGRPPPWARGRPFQGPAGVPLLHRRGRGAGGGGEQRAGGRGGAARCAHRAGGCGSRAPDQGETELVGPRHSPRAGDPRLRGQIDVARGDIQGPEGAPGARAHCGAGTARHHRLGRRAPGGRGPPARRGGGGGGSAACGGEHRAADGANRGAAAALPWGSRAPNPGG